MIFKPIVFLKFKFKQENFDFEVPYRLYKVPQNQNLPIKCKSQENYQAYSPEILHEYHGHNCAYWKWFLSKSK